MKTSEKWYRMGLRTLEEVKADKTVKLSKMQKAGKVKVSEKLVSQCSKNLITGPEEEARLIYTSIFLLHCIVNIK